MTETLSVEDVNSLVQQVAARLPFPVELYADMGGNFALQIDLGHRGETDDPHDMAGIDPEEPNSRWWLDIDGGDRTHMSDLGAETDPAVVARWIAETARAEGCPVAVAATLRASAVRNASYPTAPTVGDGSITTPQSITPLGREDRGPER